MLTRFRGMRFGAALAVLMVAALASAGGGGAPFTGSELDSVETVVTGLLAVGAAIVIALTVYRLGKRAVNRV